MAGDVVVQFGGDSRGYEAALSRMERRTDSFTAGVERRVAEAGRRIAVQQARLLTPVRPDFAPVRRLEEQVQARRTAAQAVGAREAERDAVQAARNYRRAWIHANRDVESSGLLTARQLRRGFMAVAGALGIGLRLLEDYQAKFPGVGRGFDDLSREVEKFKTSLARDLTLGADGGILGDIVRWSGVAREAISDVLGDMLSLQPGKSAELRALMEQQERMDVEARQGRAFRLERLEQEAARAGGGGDPVAAARARAELVRTQEFERIAARANAGEITGQQAAELRGGVENAAAAIVREAMERQAERVAEEAARAEEERTAAYLRWLDSVEEGVRAEARLMRARGDTRAADEYESRLGHEIAMRRAGSDHWAQTNADTVREAELLEMEREDARAAADRRRQYERLAIDRQRVRLDVMRMEGAEREAELESIRLSFAQRIADVKRDELLTEQEKVDAIAEEIALRDRMLAAAEGRHGATRSPTATLGPGAVLTASLQRAILGGGRDPERRVMTEQLAETRRQTVILERMLDAGGEGPVG